MNLATTHVRALPAELTEKLAKLLPMLGSDQMGEVINTIAAIKRALSAHDRDWHDLTAAVTLPAKVTNGRDHTSNYEDNRETRDSTWVLAKINELLYAKPKLSARAGEFIAQTQYRAGRYDTTRFSPKQWAWFAEILTKAGVSA